MAKPATTQHLAQPIQDLPRTTGCSAPALRIGTLALAVEPLRLLPSRFRRGQSKVLTFRTKRPGRVRAAYRPPPGCARTVQESPELIPEEVIPGLGIA